ncbi:MAG: MBL fold metallo-hydrolase RNA specificity domain-containing protein [Candidatus Micrarchaeota archaeon]
MRLRFLGAAREVGRSCVLAEGKKSVLLDCGVKIGDRDEYPLVDARIARRLDAAVLSHAHLDHSGYLPALYGLGFHGRVSLTKPTRDLAQLLISDYLAIAKDSGERAPYGQKQAEAFLKRTEILEYGQQSADAPARLRPAGHILGASMVELQDGKRLLYTGDVSLRSSRLLDPADLQGLDAEILVIESTYGGRADLHEPSKDTANRLVSTIQETLDKGGKVLIPSFAIGRGQEVLFLLESYMRSGKLERVPIYIDGMVKKALRIYRHNAINLKDEVKRRILTSDDDPFKSPFYKESERKDRSDVLEGGKCVIVAPSGMLNGGPSLSYLKALASDPKNKLVFSGFQAENTVGRQLQDGRRSISVHGQEIEVRLKVEEAHLSAHADSRELLSVVRALPSLEKVFVIHGEEQKSLEFAQAVENLAEKMKKRLDVFVPRLGDEFEA